MSLENLVTMSHTYGANPEFVLAGGGNTSYKTNDVLYIKGSGSSLSTIKENDFVKMDRASLQNMWLKTYPVNEKEREAEVLIDMMNSRCNGEENKRPSVETLLHNLFEQKFVLHIHPAIVNGLTCGANGEKIMNQLFPSAVWVPSTKPGYILAVFCRDAINKYIKEHGTKPEVLFLQNHGIFFAGNTTQELDIIVEKIMKEINAYVKRVPDFSDAEFDVDKAASIAPVIRMIYGEGNPAFVKFTCNREILNFANSESSFVPLIKSFTPDHIVYCKALPIFIPSSAKDTDIKVIFDKFLNDNGYTPKIIFVEKLGMFSCGKTKKESETAKIVFIDAIKIAVYSESFGGYSPMVDEQIDFIVNWEVESYRQKVSLSGATSKRLSNKVSIITGSAQGFGKGIAEEMIKEGAHVVIADMNFDGAKTLASSINNDYGAGTAIAVMVNVTDEVSVKKMIDDTVLEFGGLDIFVNNAGIVKAGNLEEMQKNTFEFVTAVNYTAYFLCTKYASRPMKIQHKVAPKYYMDIIEINSKSGLAGSNKNFAYAGSKFGGIGLTQSFALELVEYNIKVNAVCPGNFLDGPLWADPEKGLFVQYLSAGKVPGAKTIADVREFYESKVPLHRGCETLDVARAIFYIVEQLYETGQALPVTGGQEMLK